MVKRPLVLGKITQDIKIIYFDEIDSTNNFLKTIPYSPTKDILVIHTNYQTQGRGQGNHTWESPKGENILFSFALHTNVSCERSFLLNKCVALSIVHVLENMDIQAKIKWPNDIYVGNKKIAGILIENRIKKNRIKKSVIGIGMNVNQKYFNTKDRISIALIKQKYISKNRILLNILHAFKKYYNSSSIDIENMYHKKLGFMDTRKFIIQNQKTVASILSADNNGTLTLIKNNRKIKVQHSELQFVLE